MGMSPSFDKLKKLSVEELEQLYDKEAQSSVIGTNFYLDELARRAQDRQSSLMLSYTKRMLWLTVIIGIFTLANLAASAIPLLKILEYPNMADHSCKPIIP